MYDQYEQHEDHFYIEPPEAVLRLLELETFTGSIHDPACGTATIPRIFVSAGHSVSCSDIKQRFDGSLNFRRGDFLRDRYLHLPYDNIVSNPPYKLAEEFLHTALSLVNYKVAFLLRLAFLEGQGRYSRVFCGKTPLSHVYVFPDRVNMPPGDKLLSGEAKREGGKHAFAWFVWDKSYVGEPRLGWMPM